MKRLLIACYLIPAIVYMWPFDRILEIDLYIYFLPNYLYFAAPVIAWGLVTCSTKPSKLLSSAGYVGAVSPLVYLAFLFNCCVDNSNAMGWLYLWPYSLLAIILSAGGAYLWNVKFP